MVNNSLFPHGSGNRAVPFCCTVGISFPLLTVIIIIIIRVSIYIINRLSHLYIDPILIDPFLRPYCTTLQITHRGPPSTSGSMHC